MTAPVAAAEAMIAADRRHGDPAIWITRVPDDAILARARTLEAEGPRDRPLWGVPVAVKDNIDVAGLPTTAGCPGFASTPARHATCVERLVRAGANIVGKTNLDQFATGLVGVRSPYGVPRNLFDATRVPGGSSSGSAVAVASGIVPLALGTDTAGSGRVPAMFGNIVGLKPTIGSIPATGVVPACRSVDTVSVLAGTVDAALAAASVLAGPDDADPYGRAAPVPHLRRGALGRPLVACLAPDACEPGVAAVYRATAARLGAEEIDAAPYLRAARLLYEGPWVAERTSALRAIVSERPGILLPVTRAILQGGFDRRAVDAFDAFHLLAEIRLETARLWRRFEALLLPTAPGTPTLAALEADPVGPNSWLGTYTNFVNLCDLAGWAVPAGFADGLPVGVTVVGPAWSEGRLAALADAIHRAATDRVGATGMALPAPSAPAPLAADETALFCAGADMPGLAMDGALAARGGRLLRAARTLPEYRLSDPGTRPGLVRAPGAGAAIAGEVWALPTAGIGALLGEIQPPPGLGTVLLEGGPCLGFLAA